MIIATSKQFTASQFEKIELAARLCTEFYESHLGVILERQSFTYTEDTPEQVFNKLSSGQHGLIVAVYPWKPLNPWTAAIATTYKNKPGEIYINVRKIEQRSVEDYVATLTHECCHVLKYSHGSNANQGSQYKRNSVPVWLAEQAKKWAEGRVR